MARSDSVRNRARLIEAAREVFAERGFEATLDDIARHAGLGTGTAYRHFPNKRAIAAEVLTEATEQIVADARESLSVDDPWTALTGFFTRTGARQARDRGLYETLTGQGDQAEQERIWPEIIAAVTELFQRAQRAGVVRADAAPQDIAAIFALLGPAFAMSRTSGPDLWRRYLALVLDGLRATDRPELPAPPPPLADLRTILRAGK
ncbi:TetR/AcrR family transcriptional regulator [Actinoplanes sp. NBRC 103695]|uniref:TetR/AcrR family transcriptional regulator n=1 Tax=Actinoplanes sp. NBRC 103695 TaxID=3032202 RepID=UPI0024A220EB|nr:TetR/AcrR family transcriptional regulator [Actinoplanes sp. NBRC 103695]GLY93174.1 TetR family transcriptional regulator [Actinoplanes sp. NBRC 103695]